MGRRADHDRLDASTASGHPVQLPMYDWPEVRAATAMLECAVQAAVLDELGWSETDLEPWPASLDLASRWGSPRLLVSQTCGYPLVSHLRDIVVPIVTPHYAIPGCDGPTYSSFLLVRDDSMYSDLADLHGKRAVYNSRDSQSGYNAFRHSVAPLAESGRFFDQTAESGGHLLSMQAVADGHADIACIDAVCWALAQRHLPDLAVRLRPIGQTASVPGLPLITSARFCITNRMLIREAVIKALSVEETNESRKRLCICGFSVLSVEDYAPVLALQHEAQALGYPILA